MIKRLHITLVLIFLGIVASAQVKIGTNSSVVNPNSILELESTDKGLLLSRVALTSTTSFLPLAAHIQGMMVYNTAATGDVLPGIYTNNGGKWVATASATVTDATATSGGIINTTTQTLGTGAKTFTNDLVVNGVTFGKGTGGVNTNTAIGNSALLSNSTGTLNTATGYNALLKNSTGASNTATGNNALLKNTTGATNTATGNSTLLFNTSGSHNTATGEGSLLFNLTGNSNTATGEYSNYMNSTGNNNTAIGEYALYQNTTGSNNTALGNYSLRGNYIGTNNSALGSYTIFAGDFNNSTAIGAGAAIYASNNIQIGNNQITKATVQVAWTITSDRRWKSDIKTSNLGLDFIKQLHPVSYLRKNDESKKTEYGFIAQELEEILHKIGITNSGILTKDGQGMYQVRYNDFMAPIVKAIQEQQIIIEAQQKQIDELKVLVEQLATKK